PTYQWYNGATAISGATNSTYTSTALANGNSITVVMTSNASPCLTGSPATSNAINMTVNPNLPASVSIAASPSGAICAGTSVTFTATPTNGGTAPTYQWYNGATAISGATNSTYTSTALANGDAITVRMTSNASPCLTGSPATSNAVNMSINQIASTPTVGTITSVNCSNLGSVVLSGLPSGTWQINQSGTVNGTINNSGSSYTVTGLIEGTYTFTVETSTTCVSNPTGSVVIGDNSSTVWNGNTWSKGDPDSTKSIVIASVTPNQPFSTATPVVNGCSLTIDPGVIVTVPTGLTLRITNAVTTNGQLIFEHNSSLIQTTNAVNTGEIVYKRETSVRRYDLTYWSTPVTKSNFTMHDFSPNTLYDKYYYYDSDLKWVIDYNGKMDMTIGRGFSIRAPQTFDINSPSVFTGLFTGIPNNGDIPATVSQGKWNLVGNPYPSAIDAVALINANTDLGALYLWTHNSTPTKQAGSNVYTYASADFAVFNLLGGAGGAELDGQQFQGYIAAGQGFICKPTTATLNFTNVMRVDGNNTQFYKTAKTEGVDKNRLWMTLSNTEGAYKQVLLGYAQGATNDIDVNYDAATMGSNSYVDFYTINGTKKLTIQGRALPFDNTEVIPLGYKSAIAGDMTIAIDQADGFFDTQEVYLEDKTTGTVTDLRAGNYTFNTAIGTFTDRFTLKYTNKTLGNEEFENLENSVLVSVKNQVVKITSSQETIKEVNIYNIGAQLLYSKNKVNASELQIANLHSTDQVILVKVTLENGYTFTKKAIFSNLK
ncbi:T9SS sorting signal type C domain-containing protein, partial [Flavobacterium sp. SH_e]|uniref:T9SS sorting signal type C domain-containing protein n=1 Tax=Flavobacterium sp. SH_e TaxID=2983767 RepID=UPI0021E3F9CE